MFFLGQALSLARSCDEKGNRSTNTKSQPKEFGWLYCSVGETKKMVNTMRSHVRRSVRPSGRASGMVGQKISDMSVIWFFAKRITDIGQMLPILLICHGQPDVAPIQFTRQRQQRNLKPFQVPINVTRHIVSSNRSVASRSAIRIALDLQSSAQQPIIDSITAGLDPCSNYVIKVRLCRRIRNEPINQHGSTNGCSKQIARH